ncbi:MAG: hypothetical protein QM809_02015 [Gordonia sp. (in: high G+C Gram-positive bacteria)]|uniref:hypothetical protein n=1 Tax=Gordonia sp. (in: high G+C Gram-positive bacteria) TaxID=84139 RepID=UPI0039E60685
MHPSFHATWKRVLVVLLAFVAALPLMAGKAAAEPSDSKAKTAEPSTTIQRSEKDIKIRIKDGSLSVDDGYLVFKNEADEVVYQHNLTFVAPDKREFPVAATVDGDTATLVPSKTALKKDAGRDDICGPMTRAQRDSEAQARLNSELGTSVTIGALVGTAIGAIIGLVGIVTVPIGAAVGALVGAGLGLGGAVSAGAFDRYNRTVRSPFKPIKCSIYDKKKPSKTSEKKDDKN